MLVISFLLSVDILIPCFTLHSIRAHFSLYGDVLSHIQFSFHTFWRRVSAKAYAPISPNQFAPRVWFGGRALLIHLQNITSVHLMPLLDLMSRDLEHWRTLCGLLNNILLEIPRLSTCILNLERQYQDARGDYSDLIISCTLVQLTDYATHLYILGNCVDIISAFHIGLLYRNHDWLQTANGIKSHVKPLPLTSTSYLRWVRCLHHVPSFLSQTSLSKFVCFYGDRYLEGR